MSTNLISLGLQYLTPEVIAKIASALGADRTLIGKAVTAALPALIGSLGGVASKPGGAINLDKMLNKQDPGILDSLSSIIGGSGQQDLIKGGIGALSSLLGNSSVPSLAGALGKYSGLNQGTSTSLLGVLAPALFGLLGQQKQKQGLDASGLAQLLTSQKDNVSAAMPAGFSDLLKDADIPGFSAIAGQTPRAATPTSTKVKTSSRNWTTWLLPLVALAGLAWWFLGDRSSDVPQPPPAQPAAVEKAPSPTGLVVNGTDLRQSWDKTLKGLTTALGTVADPVSAQSALPQLNAATTELEELAALSGQLPTEGQSVLATLVANARPSIEKVFAKVLAIPGVSQIAEPVINKLRAHLDQLAKS